MPILENYHEFDGLHWQTGYVRNVLAYQGIKAPHTGKPFTEAMLMGIAGGLSAGYFAFEYEGYPPHLHFLTRYPFNDDMPRCSTNGSALPEISTRRLIQKRQLLTSSTCWRRESPLWCGQMSPAWIMPCNRLTKVCGW